MKKTKMFLVSTVFVSMFPSLSFAGEYAWGAWNSNDEVAMKSAFTLAELKVKSRGKGCIGRGKDDTITEELIMEENGDKKRYGVFISHHNSSCNIKTNIIQNISRETGIDVNRLIGAWVGK